MEQGIRNRSKLGRAFARAQRENMGASEKILWAYLRGGKLGDFRFRRQVPVLDYYLDFYCGEAMLAVELDGEQHLFRVDRDSVRDRRLADEGIETVRIPSLDLFEEAHPEMLSKWLAHVEAVCWWRSSR